MKTGYISSLTEHPFIGVKKYSSGLCDNNKLPTKTKYMSLLS